MKATIYFLFLFITLLLLSQDVDAQKLGKSLVEADISKAEVLISQKKYKEANKLLDKSIESSRSLSLFLELSRANYLKGDISTYLSRYEEAFNYYWVSYTVSRLSDNQLGQFESLFRLGELFHRNGYYRKALEYFEQCDSLFYVVRTAKYKILLNDRLSDCYYKTRKYKKASSSYFELRKYSIQYQKFDMEVKATKGIANCYAQRVEYNAAIEYELLLIPRFKSVGMIEEIDNSYLRIASDYKRVNKPQKADEFYNLVLLSESKTNDTELEALINSAQISISSHSINTDKAVRHLDQAYQIAQQINNISAKLDVLNLYALLYYKKSDFKKAKEFIQKAIEAMPDENFYDEKLMIFSLAIQIYQKDKEHPKVLEYQKNYIDVLQQKLNKREYELLEEQKEDLEIEKMERIGQISSFENQLIKLFKDRIAEKEVAYNNKVRLMDSERKRRELISTADRLLVQSRLDSIRDENEKRKVEQKLYHAQRTELKANTVIQRDSIKSLQFEREIKTEQNKALRAKRSRNYLIAFIVVGIIVLIILMVFFISIRKTNRLLKSKNEIIAHEHQLTEEALIQLKKTQAQLLESERLASLGQLTAGIAHEIRNPLNFVNNFSELNLELAQELKEEILENINDSEVVEDVTELAEMIRVNSEKISQHGERAARIIMQMLDSSREGSSIFEDTDISQLLEETANLAYQGVRGRNTDFNANMKFSFDPNIKKISVVSNDLGRVFINLITNSCHAMMEKKKTNSTFEPTIYLSTHDLGDSIEIVIEDNGIGISEELKSKVFDPFFTTKPTGVGTGLGLTMSFDILTKIHKGEIIVDSKINEFTRFKLIIPKNIN